MKSLARIPVELVTKLLFFVCRAYVEWYMRFYNLPFSHDIESYLDVADIRK